MNSEPICVCGRKQSEHPAEDCQESVDGGI